MPLSHSTSTILFGAWLAVGVPVSASANVITDWDEKGVAALTPAGAVGGTQQVYTAQRMMGMVHAAMFDAVNSIERRYQPYLIQLPADPATSKDTAAAAAAATVLATQGANTAGEMKTALGTYLASIADNDAAKANGIKLGEAVAAKVLEARAHDGHDVLDEYRPRTTAGVYVPTPITAASSWSKVTPFALTAASQFRPDPPVSLSSGEWATDYNEIKDYGGKTSTKRSPQQTETARFWLMAGPPAYHPFMRQLVLAKQMDVSDSARLMALAAIGLNDALIAVFDAKYHYNFWRPITAIRNGDIDGNDATEREASWQPIENTPMHPEYPCAHCILSGTIAGIVKTELRSDDIPEIAITSTTLPDVTHRFTNVMDLAQEVANARICAGFHYRFSARAGTGMGLQIGEYVAKNVMQPVKTAGSAQPPTQGLAPAGR
jgi:hypothetical protein